MEREPLHQIIDRLYIGDHRAISNKAILDKHKITHIVNCTSEVPNYFEKKYRYLKLGLNDDLTEILFDLLEPSYRYINSVLSIPTTNVIIHCYMGKSRSASILIYYLMRKLKISYHDALKLVRSKRKIVQPNKWYEKQLLDTQVL